MNCPDCSGPMWDNRADKRNPKSPDFKCKNKGCGKGVWEKAQDVPAAAPSSNGNTNGNGHAPAMHGAALGPLYNECLSFAKAACTHHFGPGVLPSDVIAAAATLFIQATKEHAPIRAPKAPPKPAPPPEPVYQPTDDDLPF